MHAVQVCGLVFEASDSIDDLASVVGEACQRLSAANIPHNLFVVDCGQRIFLFPNAFARAKAKGLVPNDLLDSQVQTAHQTEMAISVETKRGCRHARQEDRKSRDERLSCGVNTAVQQKIYLLAREHCVKSAALRCAWFSTVNEKYLIL
jgi:hypothetical protein